MVGETPKEAGRETGRDAGRERPSGARREGGFWRGLALVLVGGVLGAALTLLGLLLSSGTLDYASRGHLDALSRNMGTMQANQEVIWQRLDGIDPLVAEQRRDLVALARLCSRPRPTGRHRQRCRAEEQVTTPHKRWPSAADADSSWTSLSSAWALWKVRQRISTIACRRSTTLSPLVGRRRYNSFFDALRNWSRCSPSSGLPRSLAVAARPDSPRCSAHAEAQRLGRIAGVDRDLNVAVPADQGDGYSRPNVTISAL